MNTTALRQSIVSNMTPSLRKMNVAMAACPSPMAEWMGPVPALKRTPGEPYPPGGAEAYLSSQTFSRCNSKV